MIVFIMAAAGFLTLAAAMRYKLKHNDPYGLKASRRAAAQEARAL